MDVRASVVAESSDATGCVEDLDPATSAIEELHCGEDSVERGIVGPSADRGALAESERQFSSLLNVLAGVFYRCEHSPPWRMEHLSRGVEVVTGYSAGHFENMTWQDLMHPDDVADVEDKIAAAIARTEPFSVTYRIRHRSGEIRWVKEQGHAVLGPDDSGLFLEGMITDVSEQHSLRQASADAQIAAAANAERLAQVLESTTDCVFSLSRDWRFTYLNGRARAEICADRELEGTHILEAFPQLVETPFWQTYQRVMREKKPHQAEAFMPGLAHWYEVHAAPIDDGITVFFRNIDDRRRADEALRDREAQLRKTLDHIPQMVWSTRPDGFHDYYNRLWYEFTGAPTGSTDGEGWNDMFHPEDQERAWAAWSKSLATGDPYEIEYRLRHHSGEYRWVLGRAAPELDELGQIKRWHGTCTDIHERVCAQQALHDSRSVQESVLEASADCIKIVLPDGSLDYMNGPGLRAMELDALDQLRGTAWAALWPDEGKETLQACMDRALAGEVARFTGFCPTVSDKPRWWDVVITPMKNEQGEITRLLSISRDITKQRETAQELKWASEHDALTDLPNRRAFESHLQAATIRAMQSGGDVALLLLDLDHFKHVNDTLGHGAGDHLLRVFGRRLKKSVRSSDFVARLGGDEFAIVLEGAAGNLDPMQLGEAIVERLRQPVRFEGRYVSAGASVGGAVFPQDGASANELLKNADIALYALKNSGRGGTRMFHSHMREQAQIVASQLTLARVALSEKSVEPHYQQKVNLRTGRIAGMEALLRWRHGTRGLQLPNTVSEAFKDYELAAKIGDLMQRRVFSDLRRWISKDLSVGFVAINAAPAEFLRDDFAERLIARMEEYSIPPSLIEVEVTEHVFLNSGSDHVARALKLLSQTGVRIALDDFGTGHSSLSHLRDFPVDVVKIDRSFVEKMTFDSEVRAIVQAVLNLCRSLKIDVVAEGIETDIQRRLLLDDGCKLGQGFYFGKAIEADAVPKLFRATSKRLVA